MKNRQKINLSGQKTAKDKLPAMSKSVRDLSVGAVRQNDGDDDDKLASMERQGRKLLPRTGTIPEDGMAKTDGEIRKTMQDYEFNGGTAAKMATPAYVAASHGSTAATFDAHKRTDLEVLSETNAILEGAVCGRASWNCNLTHGSY